VCGATNCSATHRNVGYDEIFLVAPQRGARLTKPLVIMGLFPRRATNMEVENGSIQMRHFSSHHKHGS
jgi:hypothetical protein